MLRRQLDIYTSETQWRSGGRYKKQLKAETRVRRLSKGQSPGAHQRVEVMKEEPERRLNLWPLRFPHIQTHPWCCEWAHSFMYVRLVMTTKMANFLWPLTSLNRNGGKGPMCCTGAYSHGSVLIYRVSLTAPNFLTEQSEHHQVAGWNVATSLHKDWICELAKHSQAYFTSSKLMHREINWFMHSPKYVNS